VISHWSRSLHKGGGVSGRLASSAPPLVRHQGEKMLEHFLGALAIKEGQARAGPVDERIVIQRAGQGGYRGHG